MLPYKGESQFNILHDWMCLVFWLGNVCPEMKPGSGVALIYRLENCLMEARDDVNIEDIPESEENCRHVITQYMEVVQKYPEFIVYWKVMGRRDERVRDYGTSFRTHRAEENPNITEFTTLQARLDAAK